MLNLYKSSLTKLINDDKSIQINYTVTDGYFLSITHKRYETLKKITDEKFKTKLQTNTLKITNEKN